MAKKLCVLFALVSFLAGTASAQDAATLLRNAAAAMGAANVKSIRYSGTGWWAHVGQGYTPDQDWPRSELTAYTRTIDYENPSSAEELSRRQGAYPPQGGGGTPIVGDWIQKFYVSGDAAWNVEGANAVPAPRLATAAGGLTPEERQLDVWLSPHGVLKAAMAATNATAVSMVLEGQPKTIVSFTTMGKYRVNVTITADNLVERVQTWMGNAVFGDMVHEHRYTEYRDYNGVKFPGLLHSHRGDPRLNPGHNWYEIRPTSVQVNPNVTPLTVPANARRASVAPTVQVASDQLAPGVWRIAGESHNSIAVEFRDFIAVVEAPQDEKRSLAVIGEIRRRIPNKPIQYVVNTHYHFDHSGGLRTYVAQGATVVTHAGNRKFYEDVFFYPAPRTLEPDLLSARYPWFRGNRMPTFETVTQKYVISDGARTLDVYATQGIDHDGHMLIVYLPAEKILINADLYSPPAPNTQQLPTANTGVRQLYQNIRRLRLDVERHVPIHGQVGTNDVFMRIVGQAGN